MFGGPSGGFLNLGAPEVIVIGAVAWALLGPKELYRLAREAGSFLGEWQQLGRQAGACIRDEARGGGAPRQLLSACLVECIFIT